MWLDATCMERYGQTYLQCAPRQQTEMLDLIAFGKNADKDPRLSTGIEFFSTLRKYTVEISDFGVPQDREKFLALAKNVADWLRQGEKIMIHCGAGIGRTGTLAVSVLLMLGSTLKEASQKVRESGSQPETDGQRALVKWIATRVR